MFLNLNEWEKMKKEKKTSFECGYNRISTKKIAFSTNFLLISMLFLVFDVEISFLIPSIISNKREMILIILTAIVFIILLTIILIKEWKQGTLEWNK